MVIASPQYLCSLAGIERRLVGAVAVVQRGGGCGFAEKAQIAQRLEAAALVIINTGDDLQPMMADPAFDLRIPSVMVGKRALDVIESMLKLGCDPSNEIMARVRYSAPPHT